MDILPPGCRLHNLVPLGETSKHWYSPINFWVSPGWVGCYPGDITQTVFGVLQGLFGITPILSEFFHQSVVNFCWVKFFGCDRLVLFLLTGYGEAGTECYPLKTGVSKIIIFPHLLRSPKWMANTKISRVRSVVLISALLPKTSWRVVVMKLKQKSCISNQDPLTSLSN